MNTTHTLTTMIVKRTAAVIMWPGLSWHRQCEPLPGVPDIPDVDETFALDYTTDHDREVCRILDRRLRRSSRRPSFSSRAYNAKRADSCASDVRVAVNYLTPPRHPANGQDHDVPP